MSYLIYEYGAFKNKTILYNYDNIRVDSMYIYGVKVITYR